MLIHFYNIYQPSVLNSESRWFDNVEEVTLTWWSSLGEMELPTET